MSDSAEIAALKVKVEHLSTTQDELKELLQQQAGQLSNIAVTLAEIRGGKKVLWSLWSALGVIAGIVGTYFTVRG